MILWIGILAGGLQVAGYLVYIRDSLRHEIEPHPATWFMFAYGVALLTLLEASRGATKPLLVLPIVCAVLSIVVAFICWHHGTLRWPDHYADRFSFITDLTLTVAYVGAWFFAFYGVIADTERSYANLIFLICSNLTTFSSFAPLVREASIDPKHERALPWTIWALAYVTLGVATYFQAGLWTDLMIYPVLNGVLHGVVAWLSRPSRRAALSHKVLAQM